MGNVILGMTMSLDGFVEDRRGSVEALYADLTTLRTTAPLQEAIQNTGAVVMGGMRLPWQATLTSTARLVHELIAELRQEQDVALALWPDHPYNQLLPPAPDLDGWELEFTDRPLRVDPLPYLSVPVGCELRPIDAPWFARCRYHDYYTAYFGSAERMLEQGFGFCLVREQELLSEAFAADAALGMIEIGTITGEAYRGRGYAALTCAQLIRECQARSYRTYWNCSKDNQASAGLARRLGYQTEKEFRYVVWSPPDR